VVDYSKTEFDQLYKDDPFDIVIDMLPSKRAPSPECHEAVPAVHIFIQGGMHDSFLGKERLSSARGSPIDAPRCQWQSCFYFRAIHR
jgi:hypothetical protein